MGRYDDAAEQSRHLLDLSLVQNAIRRAVIAAKIHKAAISECFRYSYATHLLEQSMTFEPP